MLRMLFFNSIPRSREGGIIRTELRDKMIQETNKPVQNPGRQERNFSPRTRIPPRSNDIVLKENLNRLRDQKAVLHRKRNSCSLTRGISSSAGCCWYIVILNAIFSQGFYFENSVRNSVVPLYTVTPVFFLDWFFRWTLHYSIAFWYYSIRFWYRGTISFEAFTRLWEANCIRNTPK